MGGIIPNKEDAITPGLLWLVTNPPGTSYDLQDPQTFGGLTERLNFRNQPNVVEILKESVKAMPEWVQATSDVFGGLRRGSPGNPVSLPLAIVEQFVSALTGLPPQTWDTVDNALAALEGLPIISDVISLWNNFLSGGLNTSSSLLDLSNLLPANLPLVSTLFSALTGGYVTNGNLTDLQNFFNFSSGTTNIMSIIGSGAGAVMDWAALGLSLFGIPGLTQTGVGNAGQNLMAMLGSPNLNIDPASFNPITMGGQLLNDVLSPAGALTSLTEIPAHLFSSNVPGSSSNILPDSWFSSASFIALLTPWSYSSSVPVGAPVGAGSVAVTANGAQQVMKSVPMRVGDITILTKDIIAGASVFWSGLAGSGNLVQIAVDSFSGIDLNGNLIGAPLTDPTRVVATITGAAANSTGVAGADANGFVPLSGTYTPPAGTQYAQLSLEILPAATAGVVKFSKGLFNVPERVDASTLGNIENIPQLLGTSVQGFQGLEDMFGTFQHLFDGMGTATSLSPQTNLGFNDLFAFLQDLAQNADQGGTQGALNTNVLNIRNNKSVGAGAHSTSEAMHPIGLFGTGGAMTTTAVPAGTAIAQTFRASQVAQKGFFEFIASVPAGSSNIFTNVFSVDPTTGAKTLLWGSNDISGLIGTALGYVKSLIPGSSQPTVNAGQNLLLEIVNGSANPLTVATRNTGQPTHPTDFPKNLGTTRTLASTGGNKPATLTDAQVTYTANHPYVNFGMQTVPNNFVAPQLQQFGPGNGTWTRPAGFVDGDLVDWFVLGGGGGGQSGGYGLAGSGGQAGQWNTGTFVIGSDPKGTGFPILPNSTTTLAAVCGAGGGGGVNPYTLDPGRAGTASTLSGAGITTKTGAGGLGGGNGYTGSGTSGQEAGNRTIADYTAFGGPSTPVNANGPGEPGAGGSSGYPAFGNDGGHGHIWVRTRQAT